MHVHVVYPSSAYNCHTAFGLLRPRPQHLAAGSKGCPGVSMQGVRNRRTGLIGSVDNYDCRSLPHVNLRIEAVWTSIEVPVSEVARRS